jgi:hypothetical protein
MEPAAQFRPLGRWYGDRRRASHRTGLIPVDGRRARSAESPQGSPPAGPLCRVPTMAFLRRSPSPGPTLRPGPPRWPGGHRARNRPPGPLHRGVRPQRTRHAGPVDAPRTLVVRGLYQYVRNPMYLSVTAIVLGEVLLTRSWALLSTRASGFWRRTSSSGCSRSRPCGESLERRTRSTRGESVAGFLDCAPTRRCAEGPSGWLQDRSRGQRAAPAA